MPAGSAMASHIEGMFEAGPDSQLVESGGQVVSYHCSLVVSTWAMSLLFRPRQTRVVTCPSPSLCSKRKVLKTMELQSDLRFVLDFCWAVFMKTLPDWCSQSGSPPEQSWDVLSCSDDSELHYNG
jgi:hypothetical protein